MRTQGVVGKAEENFALNLEAVVPCGGWASAHSRLCGRGSSARYQLVQTLPQVQLGCPADSRQAQQQAILRRGKRIRSQSVWP